MVQEIESKGESSQSALKDLVCILKQMGSHAEATATIVRYRAAWPDDDRMQESLDNMLLDLFKHARNLEGQIAVTGQLINYSQKALAEGRTGWMIRTAGCKNTVSVHRRLSTLYRLRGQAQMQSGAWAEAEISLSRALHHERLHVKEEDLSINIDRGACLIATGRLIEAQDLLLHVAATASKVIDAPHKGVGGSSVGTVRRVGLALRALVDVLTKFSGGVRRVARELERTAVVVGGNEPGSGDGDGVVLGQFADDEDDADEEVPEDGPIDEEGEKKKKADENVDAEAKTETSKAKSAETEATIEAKTDDAEEGHKPAAHPTAATKTTTYPTSTSRRPRSPPRRARTGPIAAITGARGTRSGWIRCYSPRSITSGARDPRRGWDLFSLKAKQSRRKVEAHGARGYVRVGSRQGRRGDGRQRGGRSRHRRRRRRRRRRDRRARRRRRRVEPTPCRRSRRRRREDCAGRAGARASHPRLRRRRANLRRARVGDGQTERHRRRSRRPGRSTCSTLVQQAVQLVG